MFAMLVVSAALAQVTIDVSKITCDQYVLDQVTDFILGPLPLGWMVSIPAGVTTPLLMFRH
jgi:hypothetical protein